MASSIRSENVTRRNSTNANLAQMSSSTSAMNKSMQSVNSANNSINRSNHTRQSTPNQKLDYMPGLQTALSIKTRLISDLTRAIQLVTSPFTLL